MPNYCCIEFNSFHLAAEVGSKDFHWHVEVKVVRNLKMLIVGRLSYTFSTLHNLINNCLITKS